MKSYSTTVRFSRHGEYEDSSDYDVEIPADTKEDDEVEALMDALRPVLDEEFEEDEDWDNGDMSWELHEWSENN